MMRLLLGASGLIVFVLVLFGHGVSALVLLGSMAFQVLLMSPHQRRQPYPDRSPVGPSLIQRATDPT